MRKSVLTIGYAVMLLGWINCNSQEKIAVNLRTEYLTEPIGLDVAHPRFTWEYSDKASNYEIDKKFIKIGTNKKDLIPYDSSYVLKPYTRYYWNVCFIDKNGKEFVSDQSSFHTGKMENMEWDAKWISDGKDKEEEAAPLFRKNIVLKNSIKEAYLYVSAAGYYEFFINGKRVGDSYLDPGYTHFDKRNLYAIHEITPLLRKGNNALCAVLGNGWANEQSVAVWDFHKAAWRERPKMIAEIKIIYSDGSTETIPTDNSWKTNTGAYTYNSLYSGDKIDFRLEEKDWKNADFNDSKWKESIELSSPSPSHLVAQKMPPIKITEKLKPTTFKKFNDSVYVYGFDKNFAGFCRLKVKGEPGTKIKVKHGELLNSNGRLEQGNINVYYKPVKEEEQLQTDIYTLSGKGEEVFMPSFTYHGFQYVEIESSKPIALKKDNLTGLFLHTDLRPVGSFSCSDNMLNKIWNATIEAYKSNIHSIPTDCPQREKNGWTADAHTAIDLGLLGFDGITFYEKWMNDFIDNQREAGDISGIVPSAGWGFGTGIGPVWDAAMFIIPNALYNYYGDSKSIKEIYPTLEKYLSYLKSLEDKNGTLTHGLGDWVFWKAKTNNNYTSTAYYYLDNILMSRFASLLGKDPLPYINKANTLKSTINNLFFDAKTGKYAEGTQCAQAVALYLDLVPEGKEELVAKALHDTIKANNYFLDFGMIGSKTVAAMLTKYGYVEDAMQMLTKTEAPSWGYWINKGYTTLSETWTLSPEFKDASLNHVLLGDISAWMMNTLAGINYDEKNPGFRNIIIKPHFVDELDWAEGEYHSVNGMIRSRWERTSNGIILKIEIPYGSTATVISNNSIENVGSGHHEFTYPL